MKYFRSDDEVWRFPANGTPQMRTPAIGRWVEGTVMNVAEFLMVNPGAEEVTAGEGEGFASPVTPETKRSGRRFLPGHAIRQPK